jgi:hypothetical protein
VGGERKVVLPCEDLAKSLPEEPMHLIWRETRVKERAHSDLNRRTKLCCIPPFPQKDTQLLLVVLGMELRSSEMLGSALLLSHVLALRDRIILRTVTQGRVQTES